MKNIHILTTDKPSRLYLGNNGNFVFGMMQTSIQSKNDDFTNKNIYITSDEEIKEGDWFLCLDNGKCNDSIYKANEAWLNMEEKQPSYCKKIILTTDQELIKDGIQAIDDEFLEWLVKNPSCEEVEVVDEIIEDTSKDYIIGLGQPCATVYKIIIPKEEYPKQEFQEKSYSEEEVLKLLVKMNEWPTTFNGEEEVEEWFEQFKKK